MALSEADLKAQAARAIPPSKNYDNFSPQFQRQQRTSTQNYLENLKAEIKEEQTTNEAESNKTFRAHMSRGDFRPALAIKSLNPGATNVRPSRTSHNKVSHQPERSGANALFVDAQHTMRGELVDQPEQSTNVGDLQLFLNKLLIFNKTGYIEFEEHSFRYFQLIHPHIRPLRPYQQLCDQPKSSSLLPRGAGVKLDYLGENDSAQPPSALPLPPTQLFKHHEQEEEPSRHSQSYSYSPPAQLHVICDLDREERDPSHQPPHITLPPRPQHSHSPGLSYDERGHSPSFLPLPQYQYHEGQHREGERSERQPSNQSMQHSGLSGGFADGEEESNRSHCGHGYDEGELGGTYASYRRGEEDFGKWYRNDRREGNRIGRSEHGYGREEEDVGRVNNSYGQDEGEFENFGRSQGAGNERGAADFDQSYRGYLPDEEHYDYSSHGYGGTREGSVQPTSGPLLQSSRAYTDYGRGDGEYDTRGNGHHEHGNDHRYSASSQHHSRNSRGNERIQGQISLPAQGGAYRASGRDRRRSRSPQMYEGPSRGQQFGNGGSRSSHVNYGPEHRARTPPKPHRISQAQRDRRSDYVNSQMNARVASPSQYTGYDDDDYDDDDV